MSLPKHLFQSTKLRVLGAIVLGGLLLAVTTLIESEPQRKFNNDIDPIIAGIMRSGTLTILEGLPHQRWEPVALAKELIEKKTVDIHGYPFYSAAVAAPTTDTAKLIALCRRRKTFVRSPGAKGCGGFHPDWCLKFEDGKAVYYVLICFGCHDARLCGPSGEVHSEIRQPFEQVKALLQPLQKNRPPLGEMLEEPPE